MVKYIASSRNKKLSVIKDAFAGKGPFADKIKKSFRPTTFLCNSLGKPIYYEGTYSYEKHREAYERAKMWMPSVVGGKLIWKPNPNLRPFTRLFDAKPDLDIVQDELTPKPKTTHKTLWCRGMPPMQVGMIGEFKGQKAIVTGKGFKQTTRRKLVGIGDPENILFEPKEITMLGSYQEKIEKPTWTIQTKDATHEIYNNSRWFKRKNCIIKDFNPTVHLKKYL